MNIYFKSSKFEKELKDIHSASKSYGSDIARKIIQRLYEMQAANSLNDLNRLPPTRCHRLKGNKKLYLAVDLKQPHRLIFIPLNSDGTVADLDKVSLSDIHNVKITEVSKHYD
jgi:proteic killer suppression protein